MNAPASDAPPPVVGCRIGLGEAELRLRLMRRVAEELAHAVEETTMASAVVRLVHEAFPEFRASFAALDEHGALRVLADAGPPGGPAYAGLAFTDADAPEAFVALRRCEIVVAGDAATRPGFGDAFSSGAFVVVPLRLPGDGRGLLRLDAPTPLVWQPACVYALQDVGGPLALALGEARARRDAARAERAADERYRAVFDQAPNPVFLFDLETARLVDANRAALRVVRRGDAPGAGLDDLFDAATAAEARRMLAGLERPGDEVRESLRVGEPTGHRRDWDVAARVAIVHGKRLVFAVCHDVTRQRELEERLARSERLEAVGRLAGGVAHDFNNFLTALLGALDEIEEAGDDAAVREGLRHARAAAEGSAALTRQLMVFARRQPGAPRRMDVAGTVRGFAPLLKLVAGDAVDVAVDARPETPFVVADAADLERVLVNLATNARDAMPCGGSLRIATRERVLTTAEDGFAPGRWCEIEVVDDGLGMDEATRARLFEPFFTTKGPRRGTGLGLATSYAVVRRLGGSISVRSAPGAGAAFRILLPAAAATPAAACAPPPPAPTRGETILFVEDDPAVRALVAPRLRAAGYAVIEAEDGLAGLLAYQRAPRVDVVVTDVVMPRLSGPALIEELRRRGSTAPAVLVSGYADDPRVADELPPGVRFLPKPYTVGALREALAEATSPRLVASTP